MSRALYGICLLSDGSFVMCLIIRLNVSFGPANIEGLLRAARASVVCCFRSESRCWIRFAKLINSVFEQYENTCSSKVWSMSSAVSVSAISLLLEIAFAMLDRWQFERFAQIDSKVAFAEQLPGSISRHLEGPHLRPDVRAGVLGTGRTLSFRSDGLVVLDE